MDLANGHFHSIDQAAKPLKLSPHESEFASPWATIPGHSGPRHPGILACVAVGNFCLKVSAFHFRLTHKPKPQGYMASHVLVRAVTCSCVLLIKIWFSGLQELLPELGVFEKGEHVQQLALLDSSLAKESLQDCLWNLLHGSNSACFLFHSCQILTDCVFPAADCRYEIPK